MKALLLTLLHWAVMTATLCDPGGVRAVIAENLLLKQQLIVLRRPRQRAPRLTASDRLLFGFGSLFLSPGRIRKVAIGVRPSTLLAFHQALVRRTYRRLFSSSECPKQSGPKGPSEALIQAIVELKSRNPRFGCPRIARIISRGCANWRARAGSCSVEALVSRASPNEVGRSVGVVRRHPSRAGSLYSLVGHTPKGDKGRKGRERSPRAHEYGWW